MLNHDVVFPHEKYTIAVHAYVQFDFHFFFVSMSLNVFHIYYKMTVPFYRISTMRAEFHLYYLSSKRLYSSRN